MRLIWFSARIELDPSRLAHYHNVIGNGHGRVKSRDTEQKQEKQRQYA